MNNSGGNLKFFSLAWPIYIESLLRVLLGNVNVFMLSRYSDNAVAAVGVSNQVTGIFIMLYNIVSLGAAIIISQYLGAGDQRNAKKVASVAFMVNTCFGVLMSIVLVFFAGPILNLMKLPEALMEYAVCYSVILGAVSFSQAIFSVLAAIARSNGYTKFPMFIAVGMNVLNLIGNYIVIFRPMGIPAFGVAGVAVTAAISNLAGAGAIAFIIFRMSLVSLNKTVLLYSSREILMKILKVGGPAAGEFISYTFSQVATTYIISTMGAEALAGKSYVLSLTSFVGIFSYSIGQCSQILIGHAVGAGNSKEANGICMRSVRVALLGNFILSAIIFVFRYNALTLFTDNKEILVAGGYVLMLDLAVQLGRALNNVVVYSLRGAGDVKYPVVTGVISMWGISVLFCWILGVSFGMGLVGIWIAFACDEWVRGLIALRRWKSGKWEHMTVIKST